MHLLNGPSVLNNLQRYKEIPSNATPDQLEKHTQNVLRVLKLWYTKHFYDFENNPNLMDSLEDFLLVIKQA